MQRKSTLYRIKDSLLIELPYYQATFIFFENGCETTILRLTISSYDL